MNFKNKKTRKYRGSKTHGGGSMKKRRGAGNRGGRGRAGSGKRGDAKKPSYWRETPSRGTGQGFKKRVVVNPVNLDTIHSKLNQWLEAGLAEKKPAGYEIELSKLGYNKLLARGNVTEKLLISAEQASERAVEKVSKAGGKITITKPASKKSKQSKKKERTAKAAGSVEKSSKEAAEADHKASAQQEKQA